MSKFRIVDLFSGAGGLTFGYAVGLIDIPDEKELRERMEEIRKSV